MQEAERGAQSEIFARSSRARAFARCMGDDMSESTAGFTDPFADGTATGKAARPGKKLPKPPWEDLDNAPTDEIIDPMDLA